MEAMVRRDESLYFIILITIINMPCHKQESELKKAFLDLVKGCRTDDEKVALGLSFKRGSGEVTPPAWFNPIYQQLLEQKRRLQRA